MKAWLCLVLAMLSFPSGCAQGYYESPPAYEEAPAATGWYKNPETEEEYQRRIWWENYETEWPRSFRRFR